MIVLCVLFLALSTMGFLISQSQILSLKVRVTELEDNNRKMITDLIRLRRELIQKDLTSPH